MTVEQKVFAAALTELRGKRTQREMAELAGFQYSAWSQYENGKRLPREDQRRQIYTALGCTAEDFELALWRALSRRLMPHRIADMVRFLIGSPRLSALATLDVNQLPRVYRSDFAELRDEFLVYGAQLPMLAKGIEALFESLRESSRSNPEEPSEDDNPDDS